MAEVHRHSRRCYWDVNEARWCCRGGEAPSPRAAEPAGARVRKVELPSRKG